MSEKRFRANFDVSIYDSETEEYISASENGLKEIAKRMNEQQSTITALKEENEQLKSYIDTIFEGNTHICKKLDIEDVQFYCQRNRDYRFPTCTYAKCFDEENLIEVKEEIRKCFDE